MKAQTYSGFNSITFGPRATNIDKIESCEGTITLEVTDSHVISTTTKLVGAAIYSVLNRRTGLATAHESLESCVPSLSSLLDD